MWMAALFGGLASATLIIGTLLAYAFSPSPRLTAIVMALGAGLLIHPWMGIENVDLVFLTAVVGAAVRYGLLPSVLASVVASLSYNFFFLPPIYTFTITDPTNVAAFFFFMSARS